MKKFLTRFTVPVLGATLLLNGCNKTEEPAAPGVTQTTPAPSTPTPAAAPVPEPPKATEVKAAVDATVTEPAKAAETVVATPPTPAVPATPDVATQSLLERIKALIAEKKYAEALSALSEVSTASLTADQQKLVEQLKVQAQNALARQSADQGLKSVGGLLDQKK
jgi:hypothetical protein